MRMAIPLRVPDLTSFVPADPVSIPHGFTRREDREIAGFFAATLAWGQRPVILRNTLRLLQPMEGDPLRYILDASPRELRPLRSFVHRTFNGTDAVAFVHCLRHVYRHHGGLEALFTPQPGDDTDTGIHISRARSRFFEAGAPARTYKHFADPAQGSAAKRINLFLRWMVRRDEYGIDFGIWSGLTPARLICPLDVHSARMARTHGLLHRKQNDWQAALELTRQLRLLDPVDPVKYDLILFGSGVDQKPKR